MSPRRGQVKAERLRCHVVLDCLQTALVQADLYKSCTDNLVCSDVARVYLASTDSDAAGAYAHPAHVILLHILVGLKPCTHIQVFSDHRIRRHFSPVRQPSLTSRTWRDFPALLSSVGSQYPHLDPPVVLLRGSQQKGRQVTLYTVHIQQLCAQYFAERSWQTQLL